MTDRFKKEVEDRIAGEEITAVPGSRRAAEKDRVAAQQGIGADFVDGLELTAAAGIKRVVEDEGAGIAEELYGPTPIKDAMREGGPAAAVTQAVNVAGAMALSALGVRAGERDYDKQEKYAELTKDVPYEYHDDILTNDNYAAAVRARNRVMDTLDRGKRLMQQDSGSLVTLAGSLFDVDLPLSAFSGGAYGSAKVAGTALKAARRAKFSAPMGVRMATTAQGVNAGLQAGVVVGAADAFTRETTGWQDIANMTLMSMILSGGVGGTFRGDIRPTIRAAQQEFYERIARDDPSLHENVNVDDMPVEDLRTYAPETDVSTDDLSIGAAQAQPITRVTVGPVQNASPTNQQWITAARNWRQNSGWQATKDAETDLWWAKVAKHPAANLTTNNFMRLYKSKSAVANYFAGMIFESASGFGRGTSTAATRMENYHSRIQTFLGKDLRSAQADWAKETGNTWQGSGAYISQQGMQVFSREVMLELNDRAMGRSSTRNPHIKRAADQYEMAGAEALGIGRGKDGETSVDGFENIPDRRGYTPYHWDGANMQRLVREGIVDEDELINAMAAAYRRAGMGQGKDADAVARAVYQRAKTNADKDIDMSTHSMLTGDGKDYMREAMIASGVAPHEADTIITRLTGAQHDKSKEGFAKNRNEIDMNERIRTKDGSDVRIVDLFDNDMHGVWQRYARQMSGSAALARQGITNRAQRKEIIAALQAEQRALGEDVLDSDLLEAMFSHFNAGPIHGFTRMSGRNNGIGELALLKRITNLALLEKLGITQLAETGADIAQNGLRTWMARGPMAIFSKELAAGNKVLLDDIAFITGELGQEHWQYAPWLDLDDVSRSDRATFLDGVNKYASMGSFIQGYTSAFNHVRGFQQKTAAMGVTDKIFRTIKGRLDEGYNYLDDATTARFSADLGLMPDAVTQLFDLVENGTIEFNTSGSRTFVNKINIATWEPEIAEIFGSSLRRNVNQLVQKSMAGEQDAWLHTHVGSLVTHLKTFPLQAIQKQMIRNVRHGDKQALSTLFMGMSTAAVAIMVRDAIDGREQRDPAELAKAAFSYSNMTGWVPMVADPLMTIVGLDDARFNPYGPTYDWTPPTVKIMGEMTRIPGALANTMAGTADWYDEKALRALPFAGTYGIARAFD